jgi:predicted dehydrogenase
MGWNGVCRQGLSAHGRQPEENGSGTSQQSPDPRDKVLFKEFKNALGHAFERQFLDFVRACQDGKAPLSSGTDGYHALEFVLSISKSCRTGKPVSIV